MAEDPNAEPSSSAAPGEAEAPRPLDLDDPQAALRAVGDVSLRLLAGQVSRSRMLELRRELEQAADGFPWQRVTHSILAEQVDPQRLVQQGLAAQRDWILRGGRVAPGPSLATRTKGLMARLVAQLLFAIVFALVLVAAQLLLKFKDPDLDVYRMLTWIQDLFGVR